MIWVEEDQLRKLLDERDHMREQIKALQKKGTEILDENRALKREETCLSAQVTSFMKAFDQPIRDTPGLPEERWIRLRAELILEEAFEFAEAVLSPIHTVNDLKSPLERLKSQKDMAIGVLRGAPLRVDMVKLVDALADIEFVTEGARKTFGINGQPIADIVSNCNNLKIGGAIDLVTGKKLKPEGWIGPEVAIREELLKQGWDGT